MPVPKRFWMPSTTVTTPNPLQGKRVLVTRPIHQARALIEQLQARGATPVALPLMSITPLSETNPVFRAARQLIMDLDLFQHVIFISANAAQQAGELIDQYWPQLPIRVQWLAIGQQTAAVLAEYGIDAYHSPDGFDSEALLASPALQNVAGDKILICRGLGGREKLAQELSARGAMVSYAELYERGCPNYSSEKLHNTLYEALPDILMLTSSEALKNLLQLTDDKHRQAMLQIPLLVPSQRTAQEAVLAGFTTVITTAGADDLSMIEAAQQTMSEV